MSSRLSGTAQAAQAVVPVSSPFPELVLFPT